MRVGGKLFVAVNGERLPAKGSFTWNLGEDMREGIVGHDTVHGYKELPQIPFIEGAITIQPATDVRALLRTTNATVTLETAAGQVIVLESAWYANEGSAQTEEGELAVRFEGLSASISSAA